MNSITDLEFARQRRSELADLLHRDRGATAEFVSALAEFDRRRLWSDLGFSCLLNFVHHGLGMSRSAAYFRAKAAELVQRFPEVLEALRDGRLCMSALPELAKVMTEDNRTEVLLRFFSTSRSQAKEIAAELNPVLDPPRREVVTRLRGETVPRELSTMEFDPPATTAAPADCDGSTSSPSEPHDRDQLLTSLHAANSTTSSFDAALPSAPSRDWSEPLGQRLHRLHLTVTTPFLRKLDEGCRALSRGEPRRKSDVLEVGLDLLLQRQAKRKGLTDRPRSSPRPCASDHVPAHVKAAVTRRDNGECQYPVDGGAICGSKLNLEFDHVVPRSRGGPSTVENLRLLCAFHNAAAARAVLGDEVMDAFTRRGRRSGGT